MWQNFKGSAFTREFHFKFFTRTHLSSRTLLPPYKTPCSKTSVSARKALPGVATRLPDKAGAKSAWEAASPRTGAGRPRVGRPARRPLGPRELRTRRGRPGRGRRAPWRRGPNPAAPGRRRRRRRGPASLHLQTRERRPSARRLPRPPAPGAAAPSSLRPLLRARRPFLRAEPAPPGASAPPAAGSAEPPAARVAAPRRPAGPSWRTRPAPLRALPPRAGPRGRHAGAVLRAGTKGRAARWAREPVGARRRPGPARGGRFSSGARRSAPHATTPPAPAPPGAAALPPPPPPPRAYLRPEFRTWPGGPRRVRAPRGGERGRGGGPRGPAGASLGRRRAPALPLCVWPCAALSRDVTGARVSFPHKDTGAPAAGEPAALRPTRRPSPSAGHTRDGGGGRAGAPRRGAGRAPRGPRGPARLPGAAARGPGRRARGEGSRAPTVPRPPRGAFPAAGLLRPAELDLKSLFFDFVSCAGRRPCGAPPALAPPPPPSSRPPGSRAAVGTKASGAGPAAPGRGEAARRWKRCPGHSPSGVAAP